MNVLLYTHCFAPSIGGIETVSLMLAEGLAGQNISVKLVTQSKHDGADDFSFEVFRNPGLRRQVALVQWADVVLYNGACLSMIPLVVLFRKPFVWVHQGYQVSSIDGTGWVDGQQSPISPVASVLYHAKKKGISRIIVQALKLLIRRMVGRYLAARNVAITKWMHQIQPMPRQVHIYNPFPLHRFSQARASAPEYDFVFLGRLVSEKGVDTLLEAFCQVHNRCGRTLQLLIIGDGNWRQQLEQMTTALSIGDAVTFAGSKTGNDLIQWVAKGRIAVIPSLWFEAMGGVALELMASGKNLIVSEKGGLKECIGAAGLCFPNGDHSALADCMYNLLKNEALCEQQRQVAKEHLKIFEPGKLIDRYILLLKEVAGFIDNGQPKPVHTSTHLF